MENIRQQTNESFQKEEIAKVFKNTTNINKKQQADTKVAQDTMHKD